MQVEPAPAATRTKHLMVHYPLFVLSLVNLFYYVDRYVIYILVEPIRLELDLSDGQMGVITGVAFAITYTLLAMPIGMLTDRVNRVRLLTIALTVWCLFTSFCGMARNYWQFIFLRIGVAAGEAGGSIPGQTLVSDHYPPESRGRAFSVFLSMSHIGKILAFAGAGFLNELIGWRWTFAVVGMIGLALAPILLFTVREPRRGAMDGVGTGQLGAAIPAMRAFKELWQRRSYVFLVAGYATTGIAAYSMLSWLPAFFMRRFDMETGEAGLFVSIATVVPSLLGLLLGGILSDKLYKIDPSWVARVPAIALLIACPALVLQVYAPSLTATVLVGIIPAIAAGMYGPPLVSAIHMTAGARMRGTASAILLMALLFVGQGIGPALSGYLSDVFSAHNMVDTPYMSLRYSLAWVSVLYVVGGLLLLLAGPYISRDTETAKLFDGSSPSGRKPIPSPSPLEPRKPH